MTKDHKNVPMLYRVIGTESGANDCLTAKVAPARPSINPLGECVVCGSDELIIVRAAQSSRGFVGLMQASATTTELTPATVALEVRIVSQRHGADWKVLALPRPMPLTIPADRRDLRDTIIAASANGDGMVFALSNATTASDALRVDRMEAERLLGMVAK